MAEVRDNWEGRVINGIFPLRRFLGSSNHSTVFLTESAVEGFLNAAIKLMPADPQHSPAQLWQWNTAATFSHPHLMRLLDCGQCEIDAQAYLFVVMEYAEESLSQILPYRALGPDEVQELLVPTLDALAFLHSEKWIQGQLKPSNFLVVNDQLKLAIDTIRPVGVSQVGPRRPSIYEPPESDVGTVSPASDIWALGVTVTEALTQYPPTWLGGRADPPTFPTNLPPEFADTVRRCLSADAAQRPSVAQLQVQTKPRAPAPAAPPERLVAQAEAVIPPSFVPPSMRADPRTFSEYEAESKRGMLVPVVVAVVVVGLAVWGGMKLLREPSAQPASAASELAPSEPAAVNTPPSDSATPARPQNGVVPPAPDAATPTPTRPATAAPTRPVATARTNTPPTSRRQSSDADSGSVAGAAVHEEIPTISASSRSTIRGHVRVAVRVTVDSSGRVIRDNLDNGSSSGYFNRVASEAARKWRFAAADRDSRQWLLRFEFGRDGTTVHAFGPRS